VFALHPFLVASCRGTQVFIEIGREIRTLEAILQKRRPYTRTQLFVPQPPMPLCAKIAVHAPAEGAAHRKQYMIQLLELLGIDAERILFLEETVSAIDACCHIKFVRSTTPIQSRFNGSCQI